MHADSIEHIADMVLRVRGLMESTMPYLRKDIDFIIRNNVKSERKIESLLDRLLDYNGLGVGCDEFKMLNEYYKTVSPTNSSEYSKIYDELYQE